MPDPKLPAETAPVVALDIGNVCVHLQPEHCARKLGFESLDALSRAVPAVWTYARQIETGALDDTLFFSQLTRMLPAPLSEAEIIDAWCTLVGNEIDGMAALVDLMFHRGLTPVFFSDISVTHFDYVRGMLSFAERIPSAILSYEVRARKPQEAMFVAMEQKYCDGRKPALYVDDKPGNIEGALRRGWNAVRFDHPATLRRELERLEARAS